MLAPTEAGDAAMVYTEAWIGLGLVLVYYLAVATALRLRPRHGAVVTRYVPPEGISPAVAAYLTERGLSERAFAAALVSLSAKGFIKIQQQELSFVLNKNRDSAASLPVEEAVILATLFPGSSHTYTFDAIEYNRLRTAFDEFADAVEDAVEPELFSSHRGLWLGGMGYSIAAILLVLMAVPVLQEHTSFFSVAYVGIWVLLGGSCLVAAMRVWPVTLRKVASYWPWDDCPNRPFDLNDAIPFFLTVSALMGFGFLVSLTSARFALLLAGAVFLTALFRHLLQAPTRAGRRILAELMGFREFLSRAEASRLNHENLPGETPQELEKYSAYAVALNIERSWGEQFCGDLLEMLQYDKAYSLGVPDHARSGSTSYYDKDPYDSMNILKLANRK
jgi:Predicted membrane protein (DUF2207)